MKKRLLAALCACAAVLSGCSAGAGTNTTTTEPSTAGGSQAAETTTNEDTTNVAQTDLQADAVTAQQYNTEKVVWGPGRAENHAQPTDPQLLQKQYKSLDGIFLLENEKEICLTFDEGYENGYTPAILDTLQEKAVQAIFFVTYDFARDNPDLIRRMLDEGHVVGNHTYRHYTMDEVSRTVAAEEITYLHEYILEQFDYEMTLFRFPKGEFSEDTLALAQSLGYKSVFWSFAYADWDTQNPPDSAAAYREIVTYTHPGAILLLHAVSSTNAEILGDVLDEIKAQGYTFTTKV